jgi:hypothetical protein
MRYQVHLRAQPRLRAQLERAVAAQLGAAVIAERAGAARGARGPMESLASDVPAGAQVQWTYRGAAGMATGMTTGMTTGMRRQGLPSTRIRKQQPRARSGVCSCPTRKGRRTVRAQLVAETTGQGLVGDW